MSQVDITRDALPNRDAQFTAEWDAYLAALAEDHTADIAEMLAPKPRHV